MTDDCGTEIVSYTYDGFGNLIASTGSSDNVYGFTGEQQFDEADSLVFLRARYYDTGVGRFISRDPLGYYDLTNLYQYCINNPTNLIDPSGLDWEDYILKPIIRIIGPERVANALDTSTGNYLACMGRCIKKYKAGDLMYIAGLGGARIPKRVRFPGKPGTTSIWTKIPGISLKTGQKIGRAFIPVTLVSGGHALGVEAYCAKACMKCPDGKYNW